MRGVKRAAYSVQREAGSVKRTEGMGRSEDGDN